MASPYHLDGIDLIESVQREFTRRIPAIMKYIKKQKLKKKSFKYSYPDRLKALKMDSLEIRHIRADLIMTYKIYHEKVNLNFNDFFTVDTHIKTRTNGLKLQCIKPRLDIRKYSFSVRTAKIWNQLPISFKSIVLAKSLKIFRTELNKFDLSRFTSGRTLSRSQ